MTCCAAFTKVVSPWVLGTEQMARAKEGRKEGSHRCGAHNPTVSWRISMDFKDVFQTRIQVLLGEIGFIRLRVRGVKVLS